MQQGELLLVGCAWVGFTGDFNIRGQGESLVDRLKDLGELFCTEDSWRAAA